MARVSSVESISAASVVVPRSAAAAAVCSAYGGRQRRQQKPAVGGGGLAGRCNAVLKQHKTRLYILGRCVSMLLCWHDHDAD